MRPIRRLILLIVWLALVVAAVLLFVESVFAEDPAPGRPECRELMTAMLNTTLRRSGGSGSECFQTYLASPGHLKLDVAVPDPAAAEPRLDFFGRLCESEGTGDGYRTIETSASTLWIEIREPGDFVFCVAAQDPGLLLGEYKVRVAFLEGMAQKGGDPAEAEPDPDPLVYPGSRAFDELCRLGEVDDHGDTRRCSTPIEIGHVSSFSGELSNDWGDDEDYFTFFIGGELRPTLEIRITAEESGVVGELTDRRGYRLAGGVVDGTEVRMVKTLAGPAQYFVRVQGGPDRAVGRYRLSIQALSVLSPGPG